MENNVSKTGSYKLFSGLLSKDSKINNHIKYTILQCAAAAVHFMLIFIFLYIHVVPMVIFNIASTVCYVICGILVKKRKYILFYYITFIEICLHSYTATILVGWELGFPLYIIGIMPVIFYMHFSLDEKTSLTETMLIGLCSLITYVVCKIISFNLNPIYEVTGSPSLVIYIFNAICAFAILLFFSVFFLREIQFSKAVLEEQNARLDKIAGIDALTGLYNRRSMDKLLEAAVKSDKTFSLILCDIDDFKKINDTYGHNCGDDVLKKLSETIVSSLRDNDYVCRWGGEEILILASSANLSAAGLAAERIRKRIEALEIVSGTQKIKCSITVGAAESTEAADITGMIELADERLYEGKRTGKNKVVTG